MMIGLSLASATQAQHYPSPTDWRNENIYQILTDRFYDGNPSNDNVEASRGSPYDPTYNSGIHGGDFQGIQDKLDYIKALGATAIWISPIPLNIGDGSSAYHGYAAQDFYTLAPHWGTMTDLSNLVQAAHARGIKVILDIVCNHMGNLITSNDPNWPNWEAPPAGYNLQYIDPSNQHAFPFNPTNVIPPSLSTIFHTNGNIGDFSYPSATQEVVLGQLLGLNDLATETTYVQTNLMNIYTNWVGLADFDGFRVDTAIEVDYGFWQYWCPQLHQYGTSIGKSNFFMFCEADSGDEQQIGTYTGAEEGGRFMFDATLDYALYDNCINSVFATASGPTQWIDSHYTNVATYYDSNSWYRLVTFLDNHDNPRFLSSGNANGNTNNLTVALQFLYTSRGIPCLYYGTEQAFAGDGNNNDNREDMFAGAFQPQIPVLGDNFNETQPLFQQVAALNNFRRLYPALCTGVQNDLAYNPNGPGLFAYSRVLSNEEVFVCFNTAGYDQTLTNCPTTYASGTVLVNLLNTNDSIVVTASGGTNVTPVIDVPGMTAKIYIAQPLVLPLDPVVVSQSPSHAATCVSASAPIVLQFSKPMNTNSVQAAFSVTPATCVCVGTGSLEVCSVQASTNTPTIAGTFTWDTLQDTMTFTPGAVWPMLTTNLVHLATNAVDSVSGNSFHAPFDTFFVTSTTNTVTISSLPPAGGTTSGGGTLNCGTEATVCATPNSCYNFAYWSKNGSLVSPSACYNFPVTGNVSLVANFLNAQVALALDNAADPAYSGGWVYGSDGGSGFGPWALVDTIDYSACNGFFDSSSTESSPRSSPGIDVNGQSWGLYANSENCGEATIAAAFRSFALGSMTVGGQLLLDMDNGYNDEYGSAVGFTLRTGDAASSPTNYTTGARFQFYLGGGNSDYMVVDASGTRDTGMPVTYSGLHVTFTLGTNDSYTLTIISYGTGATNSLSGMLAGTPGSTLDSIALFNNDNGPDSEHDVFFNSLALVNLTPIVYDVTTSSSPVFGGTTSGGGTVPCGSNMTVCASVNASCFRFANWTDQNSNVVSASACYTFPATGNCSLVANFTPLAYYTIGTSSSPAGEGSTSGGATVPCGSNVTVCASAIPCHIFTTWTLNGNVVSTSSCYTFAATNSETLVANFAPASSYTITTSSSPSAGGSTSGGGTVSCTSNATVCATANSCYRFANWTDPYSNVVSRSPCYTFVPNGNINLTANFALLTNTIITSSSPAGSGSISGGGSVLCGSNVTVCANPDVCFRFVNWTVNSNVVSTSACYSFTAAGNETVVANFATISYGGSTGNGPTTLHSFSSTDGWPFSGLVRGSDSNFYGTTPYGGPGGSGTVFRVSPNGNFTNLHFFAGPDGAYPYAGLVQASDGNYYGVTYMGGANGYGAVFQMTPSGSLTTLHSFSYSDGGWPILGGLVQGSDSNLYGTTAGGGANGYGTVFQITLGGSLTTIHSFSFGDGALPYGGLVQGSDSNFYGMTEWGGTAGSGTVFRVSSSGDFTSLHSFSGPDGAFPYVNLIQGRDGNFYGMTPYGGAYGNGNLFRISPSGSLTNLWNFSNCSDAAYPYGALLQGSDAALYGTTYGSGYEPSPYGTVFRLDLSGNFTNLWAFTAGVDGGFPYSTLVQGNDYALYGTTSGGGLYGNGTVFKLNAGLCGIILTPNSADFSSAGGTGSVTVMTSTTDCVWTATSNNGFITITSGSNGNGGGTVMYTVAADTDTNSYGRIGTITIAGQTFTVTEASLGCSFTLSSTNASFDAAGGLGSVLVSVSGSNCGWTATSNNSFISITSGGSSGGNGIVNYAVAANTSSSPLMGTMTIAGQTFTVAQGASGCSATLTVSNSLLAGGAVSGGGTVGCGSNLTVCATPNACYSFVNWTMNGNAVSASPCYNLAVNADETLVANFAPIPPYTISTSSSPSPGGSTTGGGTYPCGSNVTVCASPNPCYNFMNWTDQNHNVVSSSACYTFTPNTNANLTANFAVTPPYTITTTNAPSNAGSTAGGGTVACGGNVRVCATPNSCYRYVNWTVNGNLVSTSACYSFTAASNETLVANFAANAVSTNGGLTLLWSFTNGLDGGNPYASLVQGIDCNFYGTTYNGGSFAVGTVFRISPSGSLTSLWEFTGGNDGANPQGGLVQGSNSNFYGTTAYGGANGYGTVFRISPSGSLTNLWEFTSGTDGAFPLAGLVQGSDGNFYGTTYGSGSGSCANGSVFRISPSGSLTTLWSFTGGNDGANPQAGLVQGSDSNFYGTTTSGGASGNGNVFLISPGGSLTTLWSFTGGNDGSYPLAGLVQGSDSNFYGTTAYGGTDGAGTVFRISPSGSLTNLWEFTGGRDGANPQAGLVQGNDGNFYGTTYGSGSGSSANGNVFRISPSGDLTNLWSFTGCLDGANPAATLVQGSDRNLYGTTYGSGNGSSPYGAVFRFSVFSALPPVAMFTANPTHGVAPLTVMFTDTSSNSPTSWMWTDTNGDMSTNKNPTFTYANPGAFTVQLIACNAGGCGTNTAVINVYSPFGQWQLNYFGNTNNYGNTAPTADYTGAGMSNTNKFLAGFDPLNPAAYLHIISIVAGQTNIVVTYLGASGDNTYTPGIASRTNVLEFTAGTNNDSYTNGLWTQVPSQTNILSGGNGLGTVTNMTDFGGATNCPSRYYRVRVLLP
jgi:uncharacterized repeat protein (TIGR03803 family)